MDISANVRKYLNGGAGSDGRTPNERYTSFDYCFNYFQKFRESGDVSGLASQANIQLSCLQLGFYLASWGMLRGSADLLQKSARHLIPIMKVVAQAHISLWQIDAHCYNKTNNERLCELADTIRKAHPGMSDILLTKIMLGVFGSVPAFDTNFRRGCKATGIVATFGLRALTQIGAFYRDNAAVIDAYRVPTLEFVSGEPTERIYTRAKVIDMAFFIEGMT